MSPPRQILPPGIGPLFGELEPTCPEDPEKGKIERNQSRRQEK